MDTMEENRLIRDKTFNPLVEKIYQIGNYYSNSGGKCIYKILEIDLMNHRCQIDVVKTSYSHMPLGIDTIYHIFCLPPTQRYYDGIQN
jgi:hypothetical protein